MTNPVRVRFAPSPTGHLHVGGARSAIYNWVFALHHKGQLIIRIEDTDMDRSTRESEASMLQDLRWLGMTWDEGPDVGGPHGPYRQSERKDLYVKYADLLQSQGKAYTCFCSEALLEQKREAAHKKGLMPQYDGTCRHLSESERSKKKAERIPFNIRFIVDDRDHVLEDLIRDTVTFKAGMVGDFVLIRSNGLPTYNFACVVDDGLMKISHVIRAEEHLSNTNRQIMLVEALGWSPPRYAHLALVMGRDEDGNVSKLSKRHGASSVDEYKVQGFYREAMVNYLTLLGWSHPEGKEIFSKDELAKHFSLDRVGKSPSIFDFQKLRWMNSQYLRERTAPELLEDLKPFITSDSTKWFLSKPQEYQEAMANLTKTSLVLLTDFDPILETFCPWTKPMLDIDAAKFLEATPESLKVLAAMKSLLEAEYPKTTAQWNEKTVESCIQKVKESTKASGKPLFMGLRVGMSGTTHGLDLKSMMALLGSEECIRRIGFSLAQR